VNNTSKAVIIIDVNGSVYFMACWKIQLKKESASFMVLEGIAHSIGINIATVLFHSFRPFSASHSDNISDIVSLWEKCFPYTLVKILCNVQSFSCVLMDTRTNFAVSSVSVELLDSIPTLPLAIGCFLKLVPFRPVLYR